MDFDILLVSFDRHYTQINIHKPMAIEFIKKIHRKRIVINKIKSYGDNRNEF